MKDLIIFIFDYYFRLIHDQHHGKLSIYPLRRHFYIIDYLHALRTYAYLSTAMKGQAVDRLRH